MSDVSAGSGSKVQGPGSGVQSPARDQVRSAAASIPANIAEGFGRNTRLGFIRFLRYA